MSRRAPGLRPTLEHGAEGRDEGGRAGIAERFLTDAAWRSERAIAWIRVALATAVLVRLVFYFGGSLRSPSPEWLVVCGALGAIAFSLWTLRGRRCGMHVVPFLRLSVVVDALIILIVLSSMVLWPGDRYDAIFRTPEAYALLVTTLASGMRLSRTAAIIGGAFNIAVVFCLVSLDAWRNGNRIWDNPAELFIVSALFLAAAAVAYANAVRSRSLVANAVDSALATERVRHRFGMYLTPDVAEEALASENMELGGRRQQVAILFSDLRGFTSRGEHLPPEQLVSELNAYLDAMVGTIMQAGGVVDKFIGDAIMVVFGFPKERPGSARRAIRCAEAMQEALARHNDERAAQGRPPLSHGIGVHAGSAVAGNIGNAERMQYTVVGDAVNVASRLEAATKTAGTPVLISRDARAAAEAEAGEEPLPELLPVGAIAIQGREAGLEVFTIASPADDRTRHAIAASE